MNQVWAIMADRKQGAGLSSGSSASVHKVNSMTMFNDRTNICLSISMSKNAL